MRTATVVAISLALLGAGCGSSAKQSSGPQVISAGQIDIQLPDGWKVTKDGKGAIRPAGDPATAGSPTAGASGASGASGGSRHMSSNVTPPETIRATTGAWAFIEGLWLWPARGGLDAEGLGLVDHHQDELLPEQLLALVLV